MLSRSNQRIEFVGSQGDLLAARLDQPIGEQRAYAVFAHCFTCSKDIFAANRMARALAERGIAVLRFDFTGLGHSDGEFANTNFSSNVEDVVLAADHLRQHYQAPSILIGHSLGGAAVLAAAKRIPEAAAVATIGAPAEPKHIQHLLADDVDEIESKGEAEVSLAGRTFRIRKQFLDDIASQDLATAIASMRKALLVLHSPIDDVVNIENATRIFVSARHPKSFVSLDKADHMLSDRKDAEYAADVVAAWASRYMPPGAGAESPEAELGEVIVAEAGDHLYSQTILAGPHRLTADEPRSVGGGDTGPDPYSFLLASLGACTSITLRMYADRKGIPLEKVSVRLRHEKIYAQDCESCETQAGKIDQIEREIELVGSMGAAERRRLMEIADKCPVHRTLHSEVHVETWEARS